MRTERNEDRMTENLAGKVAPIPAGIGRAAAADSSLRAFLPRFEEATSRFINGDPARWKQNASRRGDATIVGAWGAYEQGWNEVGPRYDWAAARFKESGAEVEYLSSGVGGTVVDADNVDGLDSTQIGINGYEFVREQSAFDSDAFKFASADCPPGKKIVGGGGSVFASLSDPNRNIAPIALRTNGVDANGSDHYHVEAVEVAPYAREAIANDRRR